MLSPEETIKKLEKTIAANNTLIAVQKMLIATQESAIADLKDQLAAANTVIAECREFIDNLAENEQATSTDRTISDLAFVIRSRG